jgi:hypothetical protein
MLAIEFNFNENTNNTFNDKQVVKISPIDFARSIIIY